MKADKYQLLISMMTAGLTGAFLGSIGYRVDSLMFWLISLGMIFTFSTILSVFRKRVVEEFYERLDEQIEYIKLKNQQKENN